MPSEDADQHGTELDMRFKNMSMADFALCMQFFVDRPIVDQTGLAGRYDFNLRWTFDETEASSNRMRRRGCLRRFRSRMG